MNEKSYQVLFNSHMVACAIVNKEGFVVKITKAMLECFSLSIQQLKEESLFSLLNCEALQQFVMHHMEECKKNRIEQSASTLIAVKDRKEHYLWNQVEAAPIDLEKGICLLLFHDCTESYQAQMILESSLALSSDIFLFFDNKDCLLQCSEEAVRVFGFSNRIEALGMHYSMFFHNQLSPEIIEEIFKVTKEGKSLVKDITIKYKGAYEIYQLQVFNVMVKQLKSGMAICLHKSDGKNVSVLDVGQQGNESLVEPYLTEVLDGKMNEWEDYKYEELLEALISSIEDYYYIQAYEIVEQLLRTVSKESRSKFLAIKKEVSMFRYEEALQLLEEVMQNTPMNRGEA